MVSGHRSLGPPSLRGCIMLPVGDRSASSPFRPSGRLAGLLRSSGCFPVDSDPFPTGLGSCFCHPPLAGYPHASLARPVLLSGGSPQRSPGRPGPQSRIGHYGHPEDSNLVPSLVVLFLRVVLITRSFMASP